MGSKVLFLDIDGTLVDFRGKNAGVGGQSSGAGQGERA